jgi:hypothetical protein
MMRLNNGQVLLVMVGLAIALAYGLMLLQWGVQRMSEELLTDPFLQAPTPTSVNVVWFTEFEGAEHFVEYGRGRRAIATTTQLSRTREDAASRVGDQTEDGQVYQTVRDRPIWRHEAILSDLAGTVPYRAVSLKRDRQMVRSQPYQASPAPAPGTPLKILLTSDHQSKPMTAANLQKVVATIGAIDAVFMAGDLVNIPDRASEWFDDNRGNAFFPCLQGRASYTMNYDDSETTYQGGAIIQSAPLFVAVGNHEVMGRQSDADLKEQFNDPHPRAIAIQRYQAQAAEINPTNDPAITAEWIKNQSFNIDTVQELFTPLNAEEPRSPYYAVTVGDVRLVVLFATNIWRNPSLNPNVRGRYREQDAALDDPNQWGYGQHIFEAIAPGSPQHNWLQAELASPEFQQATYKVVMLHHPPHSIGDNIVPAYTDPVQIIDRLPDGRIQSVRYEYPKDQDYLIRDVMPLLENAGVQLVLYGHSHLWNRFINGATHYLETSNVGNTYGAYLSDRRPIPVGFQEDYAAFDDPNGLEPVIPAIAPLTDDNGNPLPYIASNEITAFSILDTGTGTVSSYRFDTRQPDSEVVKFDEFTLSVD